METYQYPVLGIIPSDIWKLPRRAFTHENLEVFLMVDPLFSFLGMCAVDMYTPLLIQNSQISVVTLLHNMDLTLASLFMYDNAVLLSVMILRHYTLLAVAVGRTQRIL